MKTINLHENEINEIKEKNEIEYEENGEKTKYLVIKQNSLLAKESK